MVRTLTGAVHQEDDWYVARCLELDVASQGESVEEALNNLREAVELYLDETEQATIETTVDPPPSGSDRRGFPATPLTRAGLRLAGLGSVSVRR